MQEHTQTKWLEVMRRAESEDWPCLPSPPDPRDWPLSRIIEPVTVPPAVRLDHLVPRIPDQGQCGSCVGKASMNILNAFYNHKGKLPDGGLSSLYIYARCKQEDGIPDREGTYPRVALKVMQQEGAPPAKDFPYSLLNQQACLKFPSITQGHRQAAVPYRVRAYAALNGLGEIKQALAAGKLVLAGVLVTCSFVTPQGGRFIPKPEGWIYGGHAIMLCGYDDNLEAFGNKGYVRMLNSWGEAWGDKGFAWLSYSFMNWKSKDFGMPALLESWAVEIDGLPQPVKPDGKIVMWIDRPTAVVSGIEVPIDPDNPRVAPRILEQRTMTPARFVAEALGARVDYFAEDKRVEITPPVAAGKENTNA